ncbi:MAG TPA: hypothetical protein VGH19_12275 [Verrucomicrobiae bacterium]
MNTKKTSFAMLGIGLAVGMAIGYSLNEPAVVVKERADIREREAMEKAMSQFKSTYMTALEQRQQVSLQSSPDKFPSYFPKEIVEKMESQGFNVQWRVNEGQTAPSKSILYRQWKMPSTYAPESLMSSPKRFQNHLDLIDLRYTPPNIEPL